MDTPAMPGPPPAAVDTWLARGKDLVALVRDGSLVLLALLLVGWPDAFSGILIRAGFREGNIAGFKWEAQLAQSDDTLKTAQDTITALRDQLQKTTDELRRATVATSDVALKTLVSEIEKQSASIATVSAATQATVTTTLQANAPLVESAQSQAAAPGAITTWGVVIGSDVSLPAARDEVARARRKGLPEANIYFRNGYYATIIVTDNRAKAAEAQVTARSFRPDAYVTRMDPWCRNPQAREGFVECAGTK